jgi:hypothetical protein
MAQDPDLAGKLMGLSMSMRDRMDRMLDQNSIRNINIF